MAKKRKKKRGKQQVININNPVAKHMHDAGADAQVHVDRKKEEKHSPKKEDYRYEEEW